MNRLPSALAYLSKVMAMCFTVVIAGCGAASMPVFYSVPGFESAKQANRTPGSPSSWKYSLLDTFKHHRDGIYPSGGLIQDASGNLYGATESGGLTECYPPSRYHLSCGVLFKIDATGKESVLHRFTGGNAGGDPGSNLLRDDAGNLYGAATVGSGPCYPGGCGIIFKVDPTGKETTLYNFGGSPDGNYPNGGLVMDHHGNLYGTTIAGGIYGPSGGSGCGIVYRLSVKTRKETILYTFTGGADGCQPAAGVVRDSAGNLYGTTYSGGSFAQGCCGKGVVFEVSGDHETVLHAFNAPYYGDGEYPVGGLVRDHDGNIFGTAELGGTSGWGIAFRLAPDGKETVLHNFTEGADGAEPRDTLIMDSAGNLYGTTYGGGAPCKVYFTCGVVFKLNQKGTETVLHTFDGTDGGWTSANLFRDAAGNLYGTTPQAGPDADGVVFKIRADSNPRPLTHPASSQIDP
jgi:uncharacterized repeat protein (TIGR03803 family)